MLLLLDSAHNFSRSKKRCPVGFLSQLMDGLPKMSRIQSMGVRSDAVSRRTEMRADPIHTVDCRRRCEVVEWLTDVLVAGMSLRRDRQKIFV